MPRRRDARSQNIWMGVTDDQRGKINAYLRRGEYGELMRQAMAETPISPKYIVAICNERTYHLTFDGLVNCLSVPNRIDWRNRNDVQNMLKIMRAFATYLQEWEIFIGLEQMWGDNNYQSREIYDVLKNFTASLNLGIQIPPYNTARNNAHSQTISNVERGTHSIANDAQDPITLREKDEMNANTDVYINTEVGNVSNTNTLGKIKYFYKYDDLNKLKKSPMTRKFIDPSTIKRVPNNMQI